MKLNKFRFTFLIIFLVILVLFSSYKLFERKIVKIQIKELNNIPVINNNAINEYRKLYKNKDIVGILKIASVKVLLVQTTDNSYYLNHLINKKRNKTGSIFVDYRTDINSSKQVNVYGHSSNYYDLPFNHLLKYKDKKFYLDNKYALIQTEQNQYTYEIFSVRVTNDESHINIISNSDRNFFELLEKLKKDSLYDTKVNVSCGDDILVIQTCINNDPKGKLLVINLRKVA